MVRFDGVDDAMAMALPSLDPALDTYIFVAMQPVTNTGSFSFSLSGSGGQMNVVNFAFIPQMSCYRIGGSASEALLYGAYGTGASILAEARSIGQYPIIYDIRTGAQHNGGLNGGFHPFTSFGIGGPNTTLVKEVILIHGVTLTPAQLTTIRDYLLATYP